MITYDVIDLGALPGGHSYVPMAVNNAGVVVGFYRAPTGNRPFSWKAGTMTALPIPQNARNGYAMDVNSTGRIVGSSDSGWNPGNQWEQACRWTNGVFFPLPLGDASTSRAYGINDAGVIVGTATEAQLVSRGRRWSPAGLQILTGLTQNDSTHAEAIDNGGTVVGFSNNLSAHTAVSWKGSTVATALPGPLASGAWAHAVHSGLVVGTTFVGNSRRPAFWTATTGKLLGILPGGYWGDAHDVNALGQIVGAVTTTTAGSRACVWNGPIATDLNALIDPNAGWVLERATCLNDVGLIGCIGMLAGQFAGCILQPRRIAAPKRVPPIVVQILSGVVTDEDGVIIGPNGRIQPVPPWNPLLARVPKELRPLVRELLKAQPRSAKLRRSNVIRKRRRSSRRE